MKHRMTHRFWTSTKVDHWATAELSLLTEALRQEAGMPAFKRPAPAYEGSRTARARAIRARPK
jgi:hypothetical protein